MNHEASALGYERLKPTEDHVLQVHRAVIIDRIEYSDGTFWQVHAVASAPGLN